MRQDEVVTTTQSGGLTTLVDRELLQAAKRACESDILAAINRLEQVTGLQVERVNLVGQTTIGRDTLTAIVCLDLVLR